MWTEEKVTSREIKYTVGLVFEALSSPIRTRLF
jgi:hypothetical protein